MLFKLLGRVAWKVAIVLAPVAFKRARKRLSERSNDRREQA